MDQALLAKADIGWPDTETASADYAMRFSGDVGRYFLERQASIILGMVGGGQKTILEVGGGHLQLTPYLLKAGHHVCVQGSTDQAISGVSQLELDFPGQCTGVVSNLDKLPFEDRSVDVVIAVRLLCHVDCWEKVLAEMCRVARRTVVFDYPPSSSFNMLYPLLFQYKLRAEKNTRPFTRFRAIELSEALEKYSYAPRRLEREFFLPMVVHRMLKRRKCSELIEGVASVCGLTRMFGSPIILSANLIMDHMNILDIL